MLKIIGMALVVSFSFAYGMYYASHASDKAKDYRTACDILERFAFGIRNNLRIDEIIGKLNVPTKEPPKSREGLLEYVKNTSLSQDTKCELEAFFAEVGRSTDTARETSRCTKLLEILQKDLIRVTEEAKKKKELYSKLGIISGFILCILTL